MAKPFIHPTSIVSEKAKIGDDTKVWAWCQIREDTEIGSECILSKSVYIDSHVKIGNRVKIQNNVSVYHGVTIEDGVFVGPHTCFTNDKIPRAVNPDGTAKTVTDWVVTPILIKKGAAIGANSTIVCGVTVGEWALVGSGSVVTKNVPAHALVMGNPARIRGWVCRCGKKVDEKSAPHFQCVDCCR